MTRRLAAILSADVVGYSKLMGDDEDRTHALLTQQFGSVVQPRVSSHRGRIVNITGDSVLAEFRSIFDAVTCAVEIQSIMAARNTDVPEDQRIVFRIGIHLGDIAYDGDAIYGDCVNIACRLQALADPGGILISGAVKEHLGNRLDLELEPLGSRRLKNILQPLRVYRVVMGSVQASPVEDCGSEPDFRYRFAFVGFGNGLSPLLRWKDNDGLSRRAGVILSMFLLCIAIGISVWLRPLANPMDSVADGHGLASAQPSIAVLPFDNLDSDPRHESFSDGMTNDIITDLSKFSDLFVIAANSTFRYKNKPTRPEQVGRELGVRYVLEGSVQWIGDTLRINAQLIDATNATHIWAERFDRPVANLFEVQNEISRKIVEVIGPVSSARGKLRQTELARLARTPTESLQAYDHYLQGMVHFERFRREELLLARGAFEKAISVDPEYAKAIAQNAWTYLDAARLGWTSNPLAAQKTAQALAERAVEADPSEPEAYRALASVRLFQNRHDLAIELFHKAVSLNPNSADEKMYLGWALTHTGEPEDGLKMMELAVERNPYYPGWYLWDIGWGNFVLRRYQAAVDVLERRVPRSNHTRLLLAVCLFKLGREKAAASEMELFREAEPGFSVEIAARAHPFRRQEDLQHYLGALRIAGLPERVPTPR